MPDRVSPRGAQPAVKLSVHCLELVPDLLLGPALDLPLDRRPSGPNPSETARIPVLRRREVDRVLAVPSALRSSGRHG
jgi:hypothetical protein